MIHAHIAFSDCFGMGYILLSCGVSDLKTSVNQSSQEKQNYETNMKYSHCFLFTLLITLILLTLLILLGEGLRVTKILKYCWIDHIYYIFPIVVVSWSILDVGRRDHFGQCFRLDWRLESPHQTGGWSWVTSKMAGQVFRLRRILMTTLIQFHPLASLSRI